MDMHPTLPERVTTMRRAWLVAFAAVLAGCGDDMPAAPAEPQVAGSYAGSISYHFQGGPTGDEIMLETSGTVQVTQDGSSVNLTPVVTVFGEPLDIPPFAGTIDASGTVTFGTTTIPLNDPPDPQCGTATLDRLEASFSGSMLTFELGVSTERCGSFRIEATLNRQAS